MLVSGRVVFFVLPKFHLQQSYFTRLRQKTENLCLSKYIEFSICPDSPESYFFTMNLRKLSLFISIHLLFATYQHVLPKTYTFSGNFLWGSDKPRFSPHHLSPSQPLSSSTDFGENLLALLDNRNQMWDDLIIQGSKVEQFLGGNLPWWKWFIKRILTGILSDIMPVFPRKKHLGYDLNDKSAFDRKA